MPESNHPLTEQHYQDIIRGLADLKGARQQIQLAKMAGIDVSAAEERVNATEAQLARIRQVYFPGR